MLPRYKPASGETAETDRLVEALLNFGKPKSTAADGEPPSKDSDQCGIVADAKLARLVRSNEYSVRESGAAQSPAERKVRSWNFSEYAYKRDPCPFPTRARGLFTTEVSGGREKLGDGRYRIVARGYDKFFNVGEVVWTEWDALEKNTKAPYYLTLKSNGCIIFIAGLTPTSLVVTSKHAIGTYRITTSPSEAQNVGELTHAGVGDKWLDHHLSLVSKSRADLAKALWEANATAVLELTDDSFEEHVLPTPASSIGLNLHGINLNAPGPLQTFPPDVVNKFAREWGFHETDYKTVGTILEVQQECLRIEKEGWGAQNAMVEGVVVRGHPAGIALPQDPSAPRQLQFWKVKYEEPYLQYRNWREITRKLLSARGKAQESDVRRQIPGSQCDSATYLCEELEKSINVAKIKDLTTRLYVKYVLLRMSSGRTEDEALWNEWGKGRGIVRTREDFLAWKESDEGRKATNELSELKGLNMVGNWENDEGEKVYDKTLLVPVAAPGCGKTTLAIALATFLGALHTQSDDITTKKTAAGFVRNVKELLISASDSDGIGDRIVFADKNNHLKQHRKAMVDLVAELEKGIPAGTASKKVKGKDNSAALPAEQKIKSIRVRTVALVWNLHSLSQDVFHRLATQRIVVRGDNHQSLRPERTPDGVEAHEFILWRFLKEFEPFDATLNAVEDGKFDEVIELDVRQPVENALKTLVLRLKDWYPEIADPTGEAIEAAMEAPKSYKVKSRKEMQIDSGSKKSEQGTARYYGISLDLDLTAFVTRALRNAGPEREQRSLLDELVAKNRITTSPHVTLLHSANVFKLNPEATDKDQKKALWSHYRSIAAAGGAGSEVAVSLGPRIIWDNRVMAIEVSKIEPEDKVQWGDDGVAHVTVGTACENIKAVEGKMLIMKVVKGDATGVTVVQIPTQEVKGKIKGLY